MLFRSALLALGFFALTLDASAQDDTFTDDSTWAVDTTYMDTTGSSADSAFLSGIDSDSDLFDPPEPETFFRSRSGLFYAGVSVGMTSLKTPSLATASDDPGPDGTLLFFGVKGHTLLNGLLIGGEWSWGHLYGMGDEYDDFTFDYGGLLVGYDTRIFYGALTLRGDLLLGAGGMQIVRKRPDLAVTGSGDILERARNESFYAIRPGISIGYSPIAFTDIRFGVNYLVPVGNGKLDDLRNLNYGLQFIFGVGE